MRRRRWLATTVLLALGLAGCGMPIPADPGGTLDRITGSVLRVGASPSGTLVEVDEDGVSGSLAELVEGFAESRDARIEWHVDSEERLVDDLTSGRIDLAIGGMTADTPWSTRVSVTRAYPAVEGSHGAKVVVLLPLGENRLQAAVEAYLDEEIPG